MSYIKVDSAPETSGQNAGQPAQIGGNLATARLSTLKDRTKLDCGIAL